MMYLSECGQYICRRLDGCATYEAWTIDGALHWRNDARIHTWAEAAQPRHPMAYAVGGWSCATTGQKKGSFTLSLLHCDHTKFVDAYKGNTIIESLHIVFRRKIQANHIPAWLRRLGMA